MMHVIEAIATILTVLGLYLISEGLTVGFTVSLFSNVFWMYYATKENLNGLLIVNAVLIFINLNGLGVL